MPSLAEQLAESLRKLGVKYVFGIPGGPSIPYLEAMRQNGIEFILVSNEQSAGMMADVCGRLTGIPGVCHATFGPGATNLATGVGGALLDRSPLIAFTTEVKDSDIGRKVQMNIDHQALFKPLTKWTARLSAQNFGETLSAAFRIAVSEMPGPVHLGLPVEIDSALLDDTAWADAWEKSGITSPDSRLLEEAGDIIAQAKKPIMAVGLTASRHGLYVAIRHFAEKNSIPVVLTPMAKGVVPEDHPCYAGVLFHARSDIVARVYRQADLVIGVGYDPVEFNYESWMPDVPLVHLDTERADITANYDVVCDVTGDLAEAMRYLNSLQLPVYDWDIEQIKTNKNRLYEALQMQQAENFTPVDLIAALQEAMPQDVILTSDVGAHLHLLGQLWKTPEPHRFIMTNGWSTMGFGIPAAIAAKLCRPASTVVCITGDGGFLMNCGELLTARRLGIAVVIIVLCDKSLSLIEVKQERKKVARYGTNLYEGDYFGADRFLSVPVWRVSDRSEMKASLHKAFEHSGPVIIEAVVDGSVYNDLIARSYK